MSVRKTQEKRLNVRKQFDEAKAYVKGSKRFIYYSILLFVICGVLGFIFSDQLTFLNELLKQLIDRTEGLNTFEMIFFILQNNLQSALLSIVMGMFLGLFPLGSIVMNGTIIGYVLSLTYQVSGITVWWRLLPHGVFELPAIFISFGIGIRIGFGIFKKTLQRSYANAKIIPFIPLAVGILLSLLTMMVYRQSLVLEVELPVPIGVLSLWTLVFCSFMAYLLMTFIYYLADEKFSKEIQKKVKSDFYQAINAFLMIIFPLLVIAAIIEGILIIVLG